MTSLQRAWCLDGGTALDLQLRALLTRLDDVTTWQPEDFSHSCGGITKANMIYIILELPLHPGSNMSTCLYDLNADALTHGPNACLDGLSIRVESSSNRHVSTPI